MNRDEMRNKILKNEAVPLWKMAMEAAPGSSFSAAEMITFRQARGYTQAGLAKMLDVNQCEISSWEKGIKGLPQWLQAAMAGLSLMDLPELPKKAHSLRYVKETARETAGAYGHKLSYFIEGVATCENVENNGAYCGFKVELVDKKIIATWRECTGRPDWKDWREEIIHSNEK